MVVVLFEERSLLVGGGIFELVKKFVVVVVKVDVKDLELVSEHIMKLFEWEDLFSLAFEPDVAGSECFQCRWVSLWDGDMGGCYEFAFDFLIVVTWGR